MSGCDEYEQFLSLGNKNKYRVIIAWDGERVCELGFKRLEGALEVFNGFINVLEEQINEKEVGENGNMPEVIVRLEAPQDMTGDNIVRIYHFPT